MFQIWGAATRKLRGPQCAVRVRGTIMSSLSAERSRERKGTETIGEQMSQKYTGDQPWIQSYDISTIMYLVKVLLQPLKFFGSLIQRLLTGCQLVVKLRPLVVLT